jgi:hypothetical protein
MLIAIKVALLVMIMLASILVYTIAYASISCAITHSKALGLGVLWKSPFYWLLMVLMVGGEVWFGKHIVAS